MIEICGAAYARDVDAVEAAYKSIADLQAWSTGAGFLMHNIITTQILIGTSRASNPTTALHREQSQQPPRAPSQRKIQTSKSKTANSKSATCKTLITFKTLIQHACPNKPSKYSMAWWPYLPPRQTPQRRRKTTPILLRAPIPTIPLEAGASQPPPNPHVHLKSLIPRTQNPKSA